MTSTVLYKGGLRCELKHLQSGTIIENDAPTDNHGLGARFSPTDMVATALASCMLTTMGIVGNDKGITIDGSEAEVTKIMTSNPRMIGEIQVKLIMRGPNSFTDKEKAIIENIAVTCPVYRSLHPDVKKTLEIVWA